MLKTSHLFSRLTPAQGELLYRDSAIRGRCTFDMSPAVMFPALLELKTEYSCVLREGARREIIGILDTLASEANLSRQRFQDELIGLIAILRQDPEFYEAIERSIRAASFRTCDYTLYYLVHEKEVEVLHIFEEFSVLS